MQAFPRIGTTTPIFVPKEGTTSPVRAGQDYFLVQIHAAQAAFKGSFWAKPKRLIITSNVAISRLGLLKENMKSIQRSRDVRPGHGVKLGLRPNLLSLMPAIMTDFSVSIDFIVDSEDRLKSLAGVINDDNFLAAVSLTPGAAMVAKTVSNFAEKVIRAFLPEQEQVPILQFNGDFNLATEGNDGLREGFYIILGSRDDDNPLPDANSKFEVLNGEVLVSGQPVTNLSYIILEVQRIGARTRERNDGAGWEAKLREAEDMARISLDDAPDRIWKECRATLREAQAILRTDVNYLRIEADAILLSVMQYCKETIYSQTRSSASGEPLTLADDLADLHLKIDPARIEATLDEYAEQVQLSRELVLV